MWRSDHAMNMSPDVGQAVEPDATQRFCGRPRSERGAKAVRIGTVMTMLAGGLFVTGLGTWAVHRTVEDGIRAYRAEIEATVVQAVRREADDAIGMVNAAATFLAAVPDATPDMFERFGAAWAIQVGASPAVRALAYAVRVDRPVLPDFRQQARADEVAGRRTGYPQFDLFPAGDRPRYFPAWLVEPAAARPGVYGYDLASDAARLAAAEAAARSGQARMSRPVVLSQDQGQGETSCLILAPVFAGPASTPADIDDPRLLGFAAIGFSPGRAIIDALREADLLDSGIAVAITDIGSGGDEALPLFSTTEGFPAAARVAARDHIDTDLTVAGRTWRITIDAEAHGPFGASPVLASMVFMVGVAFTVALAMLVRRVLNSQALMTVRVEQATRSLRQTAVDLARSRDEAQLADSAKTDFLARVSHELRSPLTPILGFSEMIRDGVMGPIGTPVYREYAGDIHASGTHLLAIVNDLLDLSRLEAGCHTLQEQTIDAIGLIKELVRFSAARAQAAGLMIGYAPEPGVKALLLHADPRLVRQMIENLISNAMKFTQAGGDVHVGASMAADGSPVLFVRDSGIGMTADQIAHARKPFAQVENVLQRQHEGAGLGLALVDGMIRMHGGWFQIDSAPGLGTTARLIFPRARLCMALEP